MSDDRLAPDEVCPWPTGDLPWRECGASATQLLIGVDQGEPYEIALCDTHAEEYRREGIEED